MRKSKARNYARGFIDALPGGADLDGPADELIEAARALKAAPTLLDVLSNPGIPVSVKVELAKKALASAGASELTCRFVGIVVSHGCAADIGDVAEAVRLEVDKRQGIMQAEVRSARPIDLDQQEDLIQALSRATGKKIRPRFEVDPALLAGVVSRVGDLVFDGSARRQLALMKDRLTRAQ